MPTYLSYPPSATCVTGRWLAHSQHNLIARAFIASDLVAGTKLLVKPTVRQAAALANVNVSYAGWAVRRREQRFEILRGLLPLVPPAPETNGHTLPAVFNNVTDDRLIELARAVGPERMLNAAATVEAAAQ